MHSGTSHKGFVHSSTGGVVHVLPALLQRIEALHQGVVAVGLQPVVAPVHTRQRLAIVGGHIIQAAEGCKRLRVLILEEKEEAHGRFLGPSSSLSHLRDQVALTYHQSSFCSLANV